ncbi:MAG: ABC transporter ATP-binding protein [Actinomycetota bacterium]
MSALLEVSGLSGGYGRLQVLRDLSLSVDEGEMAVILGLNGAGKTTTLLHVAGLLRPWSGTVRFQGREITGADSASLVASGLALVPEGRRVFPALSVLDNLRMGAWVRRRRRGFVAGRLERVFEYFPILSQRTGQAAGTLSGGEQQMLAIARGLMAEPRLLLVDEASLGLSPKMAQTVFAIVRRIGEEGVTVVLVEQSAAALQLCDRTMIVEKGSVVYEGAPAPVLESGDLRRRYLGAPA